MAGPESIHRGGDQGQPRKDPDPDLGLQVLQHLMVSRRVSRLSVADLVPCYCQEVEGKEGDPGGNGEGGGGGV